MAKRKKQSSKALKRRGTTAVPRQVRGKVTKRTVARAKPKGAQVKKAAGPVTAAVETVAVEGLSIPLTEGEEEERQAS